MDEKEKLKQELQQELNCMINKLVAQINAIDSESRKIEDKK
jgi:hypothetical protein